MKIVKKVFWGLFFIVAAALIVMSTIGRLPFIPIWTLIGTIVLAAILIENIAHVNFTGIMFSIAFLVILYTESLNIEALKPLVPWPILVVALFLSIGLTIMFGVPKPFRHKNDLQKYDENSDENIKNFKDMGTTNEDVVNIRTSMNGIIKYISTEDFKAANIDASFSGVKVYFDQAKIKGDKAQINVNASFSGVELFVPKNWALVNNIDTVLGGVDEKNRANRDNLEPEDIKTVILTGTCKLSGIGITYV